MSSRPRPITATVCHHPSPLHESTRILSSTSGNSLDSTGDSTKSLISVLDHDSFDNFDGCDEDILPNKKQEKNDKNTQHCDNMSNDPESEGEKISTMGDNDHLDKKAAEILESLSIDGVSEEKEAKMSSWEKWLLEKARAERRLKSTERQKQREIVLEKQRLEEEKRQKLELAEEKRKEWTQQKNVQEQQKQKLEKQKKKVEDEVKAEEKRHIDEKSRQKFEEWMRKKKESEQQIKKDEEDKKQKEIQLKSKKTDQANNAYQIWLKEAQHRPKTPFNSFGYSSGKLTGYFDRTAYPQPGYYNPIPWQPVHVPKQHVPRKKTKPVHPRSKRWNPDKYY